MKLEDLRNVTLGQLAELVSGLTAAPPSEWVDIRDDACPAPYRQVLAAAQRGEIAVHRIGRRGLVRRTELDAWIAGQPTIGSAASKPESEETNAERILRENGWTKPRRPK